MTCKKTDNKLYFAIVIMLCFVTYLLNHCKAVYQCALFFTLIAYISNVISEYHGSSKALKGLIFAVFLSLLLLYGHPYYINGKMIDGLVITSLFSVTVAGCWSIYIFKKIRNKLGFCIASTISVIVATLADGLIMLMFFTINTDIALIKVLAVFTREVSWKLSYVITLYVILTLSDKIINRLETKI